MARRNHNQNATIPSLVTWGNEEDTWPPVGRKTPPVSILFPNGRLKKKISAVAFRRRYPIHIQDE